MFLAVFLFSAIALTGQDIHYSQFFNSPLNLNPGLTGVYNGNQRYHANWKRQWKTPVDYHSFDVGADWKFLKEGRSNFFAVGALVNYDKAGDLGLNHTGLNLFGSYSLLLGKKSYITPGVNVGFVSRNVDYADGVTSTLIQGGTLDPLATSNFDNVSFIDLNAGVNYRWQKASRKFLDLGVGAFHLNSPDEIFADTGDAVRPMKLNLYGMANWQLATKIDLLLNALHSMQGPYTETVLNAQGKLYLNESKNTALHLGLGTRLGDSWYPMIALQWGDLYAGLNYDFTTSEFEWATPGGPELALRYIISKPPNTFYKPCPIY